MNLVIKAREKKISLSSTRASGFPPARWFFSYIIYSSKDSISEISVLIYLEKYILNTVYSDDAQCLIRTIRTHWISPSDPDFVHRFLKVVIYWKLKKIKIKSRTRAPLVSWATVEFAGFCFRIAPCKVTLSVEGRGGREGTEMYFKSMGYNGHRWRGAHRVWKRSSEY